MGDTDTVLLRRSSSIRTSDRILDAIAEKEGTSPLEFDRPLNDVIDLDALDSLFHTGNTGGRVEFTYMDYRIVVKGNDDIEISEESDAV